MITINRIALKAARVNSGLTSEKITIDAELSFGHLSRLETGVIKNTRIDTIAKLAKIYKVSIESLLIEI